MVEACMKLSARVLLEAGAASQEAAVSENAVHNLD